MTTVGCKYETTTTGELTEPVNATSSKNACKTDSLLKADTIYETTLGIMMPPLDSIPDDKSFKK